MSLDPKFLNEINEEYQKEKGKLSKLLKDRDNAVHSIIGRLLHCHLILEYYLAEYLIAKHPNITDLVKSDMGKQFTQKMNIYKNMNCNDLPPQLEAGLYKINEIRNQIGHRLDKADIDDTKARELKGALKGLFPKADTDKMEPIEAVVTFTVVGATIIQLIIIALGKKYASEHEFKSYIEQITTITE